MSRLDRISSGLLAGCLMAALPLLAQSGVQTQTVVTVMPKSGDQQYSGERCDPASFFVSLNVERVGL